MGRVHIPIEQKHLDFAVARSSACCAIACAIKDHIKDARRISVDAMWIAYTRQGRRVRAPTPATGREIISSLDSGNVAAVVPQVIRIKPESAPQRIRPERAAQRRQERAAKRDGVAQPTTPKRKPSVTVAVLSERENGLRVYKRQQAQAEAPPPRPSRAAPPTKSELRREIEKALYNTAVLQPSQPSQPSR